VYCARLVPSFFTFELDELDEEEDELELELDDEELDDDEEARDLDLVCMGEGEKGNLSTSLSVSTFEATSVLRVQNSKKKIKGNDSTHNFKALKAEK
jgi:hypothetical protein